MRIGYARTSTTDQQASFEAQVHDLEALGCKKVYQEQVSSVGAAMNWPWRWTSSGKVTHLW